MDRSLLTHNPILTEPVTERIEIRVTASQCQGMRLYGQITVAAGAPFHTGRIDLLNMRACNLWAREAAAAWDRIRENAPFVGAEELRESLGRLVPRLNALHEQTTAHLLATKDEQPPYAIRDGRICRLHAGRIEPLCNFTARIVGEIVIDDGAAERGELSIEGALDTGQPLDIVRVPLTHFTRMEWVLVQWGTRARVTAGAGTRDQLREAMQWLSPHVPRTRIFGHSGWRMVGGAWFWLHARGAVGASTTHPPEIQSEALQILLSGNLQQVNMPTPQTGEALADAVRASLAMLDVAPDAVSVPLLAAAYRAPLAEVLPVDVSVYLAGQSGTFKSELSALAQAHFGAGFTRLTLPAQWLSTANALERLAFEAKDCLMVIDDFAPKGSPLDVSRLHAAADRIFRGAGNNAGRSRMAADGTLRPDYPPRGLLLATGEDVPAGHSLAARLLVLQVAPGDVRTDVLTSAQKVAGRGMYAAAMAGYLSWLAPKIDRLRVTLPGRLVALRTQVSARHLHRRTPDAVASLLIGWELWLQYAVHWKVLEPAEVAALWSRVHEALLLAGAAQVALTASQEPAEQFASLLSAALASQRAHLVTLQGQRPSHPDRWGWRQVQQTVWDPEAQKNTEKAGWVIAPGSRPIGWVVSEEQIYLQPDSAYAAAQLLAGEKRESLAVGEKTLWKRLHDAGMLASVDSNDNKHLIRRKIGEHRQYVLHLHARFLGALPAGSSGVSGDQGTRTSVTREGNLHQAPELCPDSADVPAFEGHERGAQRLSAPPAGKA
jgi:hypothetical protein